MAKFENPEDIKVIVATDCGSTTTKAILIEFVNGEYRLISRGEAPAKLSTKTAKSSRPRKARSAPMYIYPLHRRAAVCK